MLKKENSGQKIAPHSFDDSKIKISEIKLRKNQKPVRNFQQTLLQAEFEIKVKITISIEKMQPCNRTVTIEMYGTLAIGNTQ